MSKKTGVSLDYIAKSLAVSTSQETPQPFIKLKAEGFPVVLIDRHFENQNICSVTVDNFGGAKKATSHLLSMGYKNPITLVISPIHFSTTNNRIEGYKSALVKSGIGARVFEVEYARQNQMVAEILEMLYETNQINGCMHTAQNCITTLPVELINRESALARQR